MKAAEVKRISRWSPVARLCLLAMNVSVSKRKEFVGEVINI
jgi:hypothetical protein